MCKAAAVGLVADVVHGQVRVAPHVAANVAPAQAEVFVLAAPDVVLDRELKHVPGLLGRGHDGLVIPVVGVGLDHLLGAGPRDAHHAAGAAGNFEEAVLVVGLACGWVHELDRLVQHRDRETLAVGALGVGPENEIDGVVDEPPHGVPVPVHVVIDKQRVRVGGVIDEIGEQLVAAVLDVGRAGATLGDMPPPAEQLDGRVLQTLGQFPHGAGAVGADADVEVAQRVGDVGHVCSSILR